MPQFDVQHLEKNNLAKIYLTRILKFMNDQLKNTPQPKKWSTTPQDASQFILELQQNPQQADEKLQNFIAWCCIIMCKTKKLQQMDQFRLLEIASAEYQCNTISKTQSIRINGLNILKLALLIFSFYLSGIELSSNYKNTKRNPLIAFMLTNAFVISYLKQELIKRYIFANRNTTEDKNNAFLTWLTKVAEYIPTAKIPESQIINSLQEHSTPNLTSQYRRRLSSANLASHGQQQGAPNCTLKKTMN